jgi:nitrate reductase (NAD(P)H)
MRWAVKVKTHPGSSAQEIADEPDWTGGHQHRVGFRNRDDRAPGLAGGAGETLDRHTQDVEQAREDLSALDRQRKEGHLINFREAIERQEDFHLRYPDNRSLGWRYVLNVTEDGIKNQQDWPVNVTKRKQEEEKRAQ